MDVTRNQSGSVTILTLSGRLDLTAGGELKDKIKQEFDAGNVRVHLNMGGVDFINSSGLGSLVSIMKETRVRHGRLTLSNLAAYVREIFEVTQLAHIFEIYETDEEAIASYEGMVSKS